MATIETGTQTESGMRFGQFSGNHFATFGPVHTPRLHQPGTALAGTHDHQTGRAVTGTVSASSSTNRILVSGKRTTKPIVISRRHDASDTIEPIQRPGMIAKIASYQNHAANDLGASHGVAIARNCFKSHR
jgi:hypothetical protein